MFYIVQKLYSFIITKINSDFASTMTIFEQYLLSVDNFVIIFYIASLKGHMCLMKKIFYTHLGAVIM